MVERVTRQESAEVRRRYILGEGRLAPTASVEFRYMHDDASKPWRTVFTVWVPWEKLDVPTAQAVCQWLAQVMQQEMEHPPTWPAEGSA